MDHWRAWLKCTIVICATICVRVRIQNLSKYRPDKAYILKKEDSKCTAFQVLRHGAFLEEMEEFRQDMGRWQDVSTPPTTFRLFRLYFSQPCFHIAAREAAVRTSAASLGAMKQYPVRQKLCGNGAVSVSKEPRCGQTSTLVSRATFHWQKSPYKVLKVTQFSR